MNSKTANIALTAITSLLVCFLVVGYYAPTPPDKSDLPVLPQAELIGTTPDGTRLYVFMDREAQRVCHIANREHSTAISCGYYEVQP